MKLVCSQGLSTPSRVAPAMTSVAAARTTGWPRRSNSEQDRGLTGTGKCRSGYIPPHAADLSVRGRCHEKRGRGRGCPSVRPSQRDAADGPGLEAAQPHAALELTHPGHHVKSRVSRLQIMNQHAVGVVRLNPDRRRLLGLKPSRDRPCDLSEQRWSRGEHPRCDCGNWAGRPRSGHCRRC